MTRLVHRLIALPFTRNDAGRPLIRMALAGHPHIKLAARYLADMDHDYDPFNWVSDECVRLLRHMPLAEATQKILGMAIWSKINNKVHPDFWRPVINISFTSTEGGIQETWRVAPNKILILGTALQETSA